MVASTTSWAGPVASRDVLGRSGGLQGVLDMPGGLEVVLCRSCSLCYVDGSPETELPFLLLISLLFRLLN